MPDERGAGAPSHVELLNLLARAAGHRNVQALRAATPRAASRATAPLRGPCNPALSEAADRAVPGTASWLRGRTMKWFRS